ncbi:MAG: aminodeoxychorismate synthase component I [Pseudozobellia sp.]|nr:aminodeoxychorismate synthase component I [Pseudozobellia sp.]
MRISKTLSLDNTDVFKQRLLEWSKQFEEVVWLDSNNHQNKYTAFDALLAVDGLTSIKTDSENAFNELSEYQQQTQDWIFGYLSYDLKNDLEQLDSDNYDGLELPELYFFQPKKIIWVKEDEVTFCYLGMVSDEIDSDFEELKNFSAGDEDEEGHSKNIHIKLRMFKDEYFKRVNSLLKHIKRGDIYEANFCQEFYAENTVIDPLKTYRNLNSISKAPFATFCRFWDSYLLCASPERYIKKNGMHVISQPIKGTAKRSDDSLIDEAYKNHLKNDVKERAENVMIVDLVRNDLSKSAIKGGVRVEELCEVYTYEQVHQMISTVVAEVPDGTKPVDIIKDSFPMGSMTGAPKISAMRLIEKHENFKRGLYSGAVGYFKPDGDFDFNVVIRSILYNSCRKYVSFSVGSAITSRANAEKEYEECLLKARAMRQVLENS